MAGSSIDDTVDVLSTATHKTSQADGLSSTGESVAIGFQKQMNNSNVYVTQTTENYKANSSVMTKQTITETAQEGSSNSNGRKHIRSQFRICTKRFRNVSFRIFLTIIFFVYIVLGGVIFSTLGIPDESLQNLKVKKRKNDTAIILATALRQVKPYEEIWARTIYHYLDSFENDLLDAFHRGYQPDSKSENSNSWTLENAIFFSFSLVTTTGVSFVAPRSSWYSIMIMIYTSLGVPLTLVWLMLIGSSLANFWTLIIFQVCCGPHERRKHKRVHSEMSETAHDQYLVDTCAQQNHLNTSSSVIQRSIKISPTGSSFRSQNGKETSSKKLENCNKVLRSDVSVPFDISQGETFDNDQDVVSHWNGISHVSKDVMSRDLIIPIVFAIVFFIIYLIFGATVLSVIYRWSLMDSIYLIFLMFATLGICVLQDVPSAVIMLNTSDWQNVYFIIFIIGGFLLMAMVFNLVLKQSKVTKRKRPAARKMKT